MAATKPQPRRAGMVARFTAKAGPLPVWGWALLILAGGYLVYRLTGAGSSANPSPATDPASSTTPPVDTTAGDVTSGTVGPDVGSFNTDTLSALGGLQSSVDSLAGLVQSSPAFYPDDTSTSGSGSIVPNGQTPPGAVTAPQAPASSAPSKPSSSATNTAKVRYFTYAPGKAPKARKGDEAPSRGPAGTTLRFARGKGYYYA